MPLLAVTSEGEPKKLPGPNQLLLFGDRYQFLPDGSSLVYLSKGTMKPSGDFWILDLKSGATRRLTQLEGNSEMRTFDITPDGTSIVFDRISKNADVVLIELDGQGD